MKFYPFTVRDFADIVLVTIIIYYILKLFKGTRTIYIIMGLIAVIGTFCHIYLFHLKG
jgi:hypothetical protein